MALALTLDGRRVVVLEARRACRRTTARSRPRRRTSRPGRHLVLAGRTAGRDAHRGPLDTYLCAAHRRERCSPHRRRLTADGRQPRRRPERPGGRRHGATRRRRLPIASRGDRSLRDPGDASVVTGRPCRGTRPHGDRRGGPRGDRPATRTRGARDRVHALATRPTGGARPGHAGVDGRGHQGRRPLRAAVLARPGARRFRVQSCRTPAGGARHVRAGRHARSLVRFRRRATQAPTVSRAAVVAQLTAMFGTAPRSPPR